jgi:uncharacterized protein (DUF305 family)
VPLDLLGDADREGVPDALDDGNDDGDDGARSGAGIDETVTVLPWWRNPLTIGALVLALVLLPGTVGYVLGNNAAIPDPNATDVGFLQDMRVHHEQAVQMSFIHMNTDGVDRGLRTVAVTILLEQQLEIGRMIQLLRDFGESEVNETDVAMEWMGHPTALAEMPGLASQAELQRLRDASGIEADRVFVELMTEHHRGGIEMAQHAVEHAAVGEVRRMAEQVVSGQAEEIEEMSQLLERAEDS